jgi:hypothetical protein
MWEILMNEYNPRIEGLEEAFYTGDSIIYFGVRGDSPEVAEVESLFKALTNQKAFEQLFNISETLVNLCDLSKDASQNEGTKKYAEQVKCRIVGLTNLTKYLYIQLNGNKLINDEDN